MTAAALDALVARVLDDEDLHRRLLAAPDRARAVEAIVAVAGELGLAVTAADVDAAAVAARRTWLERWV